MLTIMGDKYARFIYRVCGVGAFVCLVTLAFGMNGAAENVVECPESCVLHIAHDRDMVAGIVTLMSLVAIGNISFDISE